VESLAAGVDPDGVPGWLGGWQHAHVRAVVGHAYADLAQVSGDPAHLERAHERLTPAAAQLAGVRPRAAALALTHLARVHRASGDADRVAELTARAGDLATGLRSARLDRDLSALGGGTGAAGSEPLGFA
jgi:hypothetical protein